MMNNYDVNLLLTLGFLMAELLYNEIEEESIGHGNVLVICQRTAQHTCWRSMNQKVSQWREKLSISSRPSRLS